MGLRVPRGENNLWKEAQNVDDFVTQEKTVGVGAAGTSFVGFVVKGCENPAGGAAKIKFWGPKTH